LSVISKAQANDLLRFGIAVLRGEHGWKPAVQRKYRIVLANSVIERLHEASFEWQALMLVHWRNRAYRGDFDSCTAGGGDLSPRERREVSL
jgi:hypothetical protein